MNLSTFSSLITPVWENQLPKDLSEASDYLTTAFHLSNIGQSKTAFGAVLINGDKSVMNTFTELAFKVNFYGAQAKSTISTIASSLRSALNSGDQILPLATQLIQGSITSLVSGIPPQLAFIATAISQVTNGILTQLSLPDFDKDSILQKIKKLEGLTEMLDTSKIAFLLMATGTCLYWLTCKMAPMPPMPPAISPTTGTTIIFPGVPAPLLKDLITTFSKPQSVQDAVQSLFNSHMVHQLTIAGVYNGLIPAFPSPIPSPPLPWFSIF